MLSLESNRTNRGSGKSEVCFRVSKARNKRSEIRPTRRKRLVFRNIRLSRNSLNA